MVMKFNLAFSIKYSSKHCTLFTSYFNDVHEPPLSLWHHWFLILYQQHLYAQTKPVLDSACLWWKAQNFSCFCQWKRVTCGQELPGCISAQSKWPSVAARSIGAGSSLSPSSGSLPPLPIASQPWASPARPPDLPERIFLSCQNNTAQGQGWRQGFLFGRMPANLPEQTNYEEELYSDWRSPHMSTCSNEKNMKSGMT